MTQPLNVEYDELIARAEELEEPPPAVPTDNPAGPCALSFVGDAAEQLKMSADAMRLYLAAGEREWRRLAQSLRNAAKAYEEVDEAAEESLDTDSKISPVAVDTVTDEEFVPPQVLQLATDVELPYYEVRQAATDIEAPDQGTAFKDFAKEWDTFQRAWQTLANRFRPFTHWEGTSATLVEANFETHRKWIYQMAQSCIELGSQALGVNTAHKYALTEHPTSYEVYATDRRWEIYTTEPYWINHPEQQYRLREEQAWYAVLQEKSEEALAEYVQRASLPLKAIYPDNPPTAFVIEAPPDPSETDPDDPDLGDGDLGDGDLGEDDLLDDDLLDDYYGTGTTTDSAATTPTTPTTGVPPLPDEFNDALAGLSDPSGAEPTLKPASLGGGGGGGIPGVPSMPSVGAESSAPAAGAGAGAGARDIAAAARGASGMGGPMGGMPMGAGAGNQGNKEGKRGPTADESLYEEDRAWTEAVIGNRRRKDAPEK